MLSSSMKNLTLTSSGRENLLEPVEAVAAESFTIELSFDGDCAHDIADDGDILAQIIEYCRKHSEAVAAFCAGEKDMSAALDALKSCGAPDFLNCALNDKDLLYDLTMATNYVNLAQRLLNLASDSVANLIKRKLQDDTICPDFHIKKDFTTEEEEIEGKMNEVSRGINEDVCP